MKEIPERNPDILKDYSKNYGNFCPNCMIGKITWKQGKPCCTEGCNLSDFTIDY